MEPDIDWASVEELMTEPGNVIVIRGSTSLRADADRETDTNIDQVIYQDGDQFYHVNVEGKDVEVAKFQYSATRSGITWKEVDLDPENIEEYSIDDVKEAYSGENQTSLEE